MGLKVRAKGPINGLADFRNGCTRPLSVAFTRVRSHPRHHDGSAIGIVAGLNGKSDTLFIGFRFLIFRPRLRKV